MNYEESEIIKKAKSDKELLDIAEKIIKLQSQINFPDHHGMIDALRDAQQIACSEIAQNIYMQTGTLYHKSWEEFSDYELYQMLPQYKQGLINHGIAKIGKDEFEKILEYIIRNYLKNK